jgi:DNA-binding MarR family transcriptional regulator
MGKILEQRTGLTREPHLGESVALGLAVAAGDVGTFVGAVLSHHGVSSRQYTVLRILRGAGAAGLRHLEISQRLLLGTPDVTRLTRRLEERGWITRERHEDDRRGVLHRLTHRGREKLDELEAPLTTAYADIVNTLGAEVARSIVVACEQAIAGATRLPRAGSSR